MSEKNNELTHNTDDDIKESPSSNKFTRVKGYLKKLIPILILVQIVDAYTSVVLEGIGSRIILDFNISNSIYALIISIASIGMYFVFANQYFSDRFGRKPLLILTILGMSLCCLALFFSITIIDFTIYSLLLYFFFSSDIWLIFINEECNKDMKARASYLILLGGILGGALIATVMRRIVISETSPVYSWRFMMLYPLAIGIIATILIAFLVDETKIYQERKQQIQEREIRVKKNVALLFQSPRKKEYYVVLIVAFTAGLSRIVLLFMEPYLIEKLVNPGFASQNQISTLLTFTALCVIISYFLTGFGGDLWGRKPLLIIYSIIMPIGAFVLILGANLGSYGIVLIGAAFVFSAFWGMIGTVRLVTIEILPTERRGTGSGFKSLISAIGITIGLFLGSFLIYFANESVEIPLIILTLPCFINIPLVIKYLKETKHVDLSQIK